MKLWLLVIIVTFANGDPYEDLHASTPTIVQMFEWKWTDIANECETFLKYYGYGAVQTSPPMEHIILETNGDRPWWIRYQPVSYKLQSRSGTEQEFVDMVKRCNAAGVRVVADTVLNHMVGVGQKYGSDNKWSSAGSTFDGTDNVEQFPAVPFSNTDFNDKYCHRDISSSDYTNNAYNVRMCRLVGLLDLHNGGDWARGKQLEYLKKMISYGVVGFRFDASKHMWPGDIKALLDASPDIQVGGRPFSVQEVIDKGGEAVKGDEYVNNGRITNFKYGDDLSAAARRQKDFQYLKNFGEGWGYWPGHDVVVFIEDHDSQRSGSVLTYKNGAQYTLAIGFMLAWDYGVPRLLSSYYFNNKDQGPPSSGSPNYNTKSPYFNPDHTCNPSSGWVCEHRWPPIRNMAYFRSVTLGSSVGDIVTDSNRLAFSRQGKGYCAVNNGYQTWSLNVQTSLPSGSYCDVFSGSLESGHCTGAPINVDGAGKANINVPAGKIMACHLKSKVGSSGIQTTKESTLPPPTGYTKTAVLIHKKTKVGQNLFIRGGIDTNHRSNCMQPASTDPCAIGIRHETNAPTTFKSYIAWSKGDNHLDWYGVETGQGSYNGISPEGTPLAWSSNDQSNIGYQPLNKYGSDYWLVLFDMNCKQTENGWFEFKTYEMGGDGWEQDINQTSCQGSVGGVAPYKSNNHFARCGYVNVFEYVTSQCIITQF